MAAKWGGDVKLYGGDKETVKNQGAMFLSVIAFMLQKFH